MSQMTKRALEASLKELLRHKPLDKITVSGGRLGLQITLSPDDLCRAAKAEYADIIK